MKNHLPELGWREWVALPDLGIPWIKAKVDTGARSSSLHAIDFEQVERDGRPYIRFVVHPWQGSELDATEVEAPLHTVRHVRSSTGEANQRPVIKTTLDVGGHRRSIEVTLTDRSDMKFRMLLGREAVRRNFLVDPGRSYRTGRPGRDVRHRNRAGSR